MRNKYISMKPKILLCLALVLSGGLFGCSKVSERPAAMANAATASVSCLGVFTMVDAQNGWGMTAAGEGHPPMLRTTNGGVSWRDCAPRGLPEAGDEEGGVCFLGSQHAWVSTFDRVKEIEGLRRAINGGESSSGRNEYEDFCGLLRTTNGGESWDWFKTPAFYQDFHFFNVNHGVASEADVGAGQADFRFFETQDGGATWALVPIVPPNPDADVPPGMIHLCNICGDTVAYYPPAKVIITHGDMGDEEPKDAVRISISTNLGKTWRDLKLPLPSEKYREGLAACGSPVFLDDKNGWLVAHITREDDSHILALNALVFYATRDGGETWTPAPGVIELGPNDAWGARQLDAVSDRDIFVGGGANLYVTHDGARSWRTIKPNIDSGREGSKREVTRNDFVDATHGWVIIYDTADGSPDGYDSLYRTSDGGATWVELPLKIAGH